MGVCDVCGQDTWTTVYLYSVTTDEFLGIYHVCGDDHYNVLCDEMGAE